MDKTDIGLLWKQLVVHDPQRFRAIYERNLLPLVFWHRDHRIRDANDAYLKLIGHSRQELRGGELRCDQLTPPEHLVRDQDALSELLSGKPVCTPFQKDYLCRGRGRVPVLIGGALLPNCEDEGIAFALDLTRYPSAEQALEGQKELIQDIFASMLGTHQTRNVEEISALGEGAAALSGTPELGALLTHELSQPLGSILANAQSARRLLRRRAPDLQELRAIVADIISEDRRASQLINRVRLLAKRSKGAIHLLNVNQLVSDVVHALRNQFSKCAIQVELALAPELPLVRGDRVHLHQLFTNLFSNACDALNQATPSSRMLFIQTHLEKEGFISIDVRDTGPGIPPEELDAIFKPFVTTKHGSMGIGLYICRSIVQFHGGRLWATNHPSGGAVFHVSLPAIP